MKSLYRSVAAAMLAGLLLAGCGGGSPNQSGNDTSPAEGLTPEQMENGIGPVESLELGSLDDGLAAQGQATFELKCSACHKIDTRYVGPALGDVLSRRTPAFVMNMILNPEGMLAEHPEAKKLLAEYMTPMANQNLTRQEARSIVEYLRTTDMAGVDDGSEGGLSEGD